MPRTPPGDATFEPLVSLLHKSESALPKVPADSWQARMLHDNIQALRLSLRLLDAPPAHADRGELQAGLDALDAMIAKTGESERKFRPGTAQHTLQRNRLAALRVARQAVRGAMGRAASAV